MQNPVVRHAVCGVLIPSEAKPLPWPDGRWPARGSRLFTWLREDQPVAWLRLSRRGDAGRQLEELLAGRLAVLADQQHVLVVVDRHDDHGIGVLHDVAERLGADCDFDGSLAGSGLAIRPLAPSWRPGPPRREVPATAFPCYCHWIFAILARPAKPLSHDTRRAPREIFYPVALHSEEP